MSGRNTTASFDKHGGDFATTPPPPPVARPALSQTFTSPMLPPFWASGRCDPGHVRLRPASASSSLHWPQPATTGTG
jgi:hypothetical protein